MFIEIPLLDQKKSNFYIACSGKRVLLNQFSDTANVLINFEKLLIDF